MSMTDPIADLLTRIRNALLARHATVAIPASRMKLAIVKILRQEGYIEDFELDEATGHGLISIRLKYVTGGRKAITGLERVSRPGRRIYRGKDEIPNVLDGLGITILSTSKGVMTGRSCREQGLGGEVLCNVW
jgi:small subunit ribosomal protein S8